MNEKFICPEPGCNREFPSKMSLAQHKKWHDPKYREKQFTEDHRRKLSEASKGKPKTEKHRKSISESLKGDKNPMWGKFGNKNPNYGKGFPLSEETIKKIREANLKEDANSNAKHMWIRRYYPPKEVCDDKCEICGKFRLDLELAQFIHVNVRNMDNPMIDYLYMCPYTEKNSCHRIYDDKSSDKEKEELLEGAIIREEKLKRVREFVLKIKK